MSTIHIALLVQLNKQPAVVEVHSYRVRVNYNWLSNRHTRHEQGGFLIILHL
jgi:hypothetical protein